MLLLLCEVIPSGPQAVPQRAPESPAGQKAEPDALSNSTWNKLLLCCAQWMLLPVLLSKLVT